MHLNEIEILSKHADVLLLIEEISARIQTTLGEKLFGLYLYGSAVAGDFDYENSDIDLLAATRTEIDDAELGALEKMHAGLAADFPVWDNRIETAYVSLDGLRTFKSKKSRIANISPGEPLHFLEAGSDWLLNWYFARESGVTLFGAPPESIIAPVSKTEYIETVRAQAAERYEQIERARHSRPFQAYLIMTFCRALYAVENGEQVSKRFAASWVRDKFPAHAALIEDAFVWRANRRDQSVNHESTFAATRDFVRFLNDLIKARS